MFIKWHLLVRRHTQSLVIALVLAIAECYLFCEFKKYLLGTKHLSLHIMCYF